MQFDWKVAIPWFLSLLTLAGGIWQYADKQAQANREPFLREQMKLVFESSEVLAKLASTTDALIWQEARSRFWVLYWGPLSLVENNAIERCMVMAGDIVPKPADPVPPLPLDSLENIALGLSHAARDLVLQSWRVDLPPLQKATDVYCERQ